MISCHRCKVQCVVVEDKTKKEKYLLCPKCGAHGVYNAVVNESSGLISDCENDWWLRKLGEVSNDGSR